MQKDLVSIIVPIYNGEEFLKETIESLINQTYKNIEILLIDDGSTDSSPIICDEYAKIDTRIKVINKENGGLSSARQCGIDACNGRYFATVDADDYVAKDYVEILYKALINNAADIVVCGVEVFGKGIKTWHAIPSLKGYSNPLALTNELIKNDFAKIAESLILTDSWNKMYKVEFVKKSGVKFCLDKKYRGNDLQFNYRLALHCPIYFISNEVLLYHRNHPGSLITNKEKPIQEGFEIITKSLFEETKSLNLEADSELSKIYWSLIYILLRDIYNKGGHFIEQHKKFKKCLFLNKKFVKENNIFKYNGDGQKDLLTRSLLAVSNNNLLLLDYLNFKLHFKNKIYRIYKKNFKKNYSE